ncbi:MAG: hypothetical protein ACI8P0_000981 [Planctomycetaceae bacterium]|jgi:hypothetical protein
MMILDDRVWAVPENALRNTSSSRRSRMISYMTAEIEQ